MPSCLQVKLSESEDKKLQELSLANSVPKITKQRAIALRLNNTGKTVNQLKDYLKYGAKMVRQAIDRWEEKGLTGLWDEKRAGRTRRWNQEDWEAMEKWLEKEASYTSRKLAQKWKEERGVELGEEQVRRIL
ncbi:MAG: helix-turn-helix domain-containing protein [Moorea sp. SIO2B7]|nr:helix-turn-helix domain-containing protein [Moorena sp. SIO2B7]